MKIQVILNILIIFTGLISCRKNTGDVSSKDSATHSSVTSETKVEENPPGISTIDSSNPHEDLQIAPNVPNPEVVDRTNNPTSESQDGIVASKPTISSGNSYLEALAHGQVQPVRKLVWQEHSDLDLSKVRNLATPLENHKPDEQISDADKAYSRVLDLNISTIVEIICVGVLEDVDSYLFIYGYPPAVLEKFQFGYIVNKADGKILHVRPSS